MTPPLDVRTPWFRILKGADQQWTAQLACRVFGVAWPDGGRNRITHRCRHRLLYGDPGPLGRPQETYRGVRDRALPCLPGRPQPGLVLSSKPRVPLGLERPSPQVQFIYVNAGASHPADAWLDALNPGGRLLFPLTPSEGVGGMLLLTKVAPDTFKARFVRSAIRAKECERSTRRTRGRAEVELPSES
jgi:hypothetical protein